VHLFAPLAINFDHHNNYSTSLNNNATTLSVDYTHSTMSLFVLLIGALLVGWIVDQVQMPPLLG
jgi:hypothetical protein